MLAHLFPFVHPTVQSSSLVYEGMYISALEHAELDLFEPCL
jgi:hypothetical protein